MFSQFIKLVAIGLVIASSNISTAVAQCNTSGDDLVNRIDFEIIPKAVQVLEAIPDPGEAARSTTHPPRLSTVLLTGALSLYR